MNDFALIEMAIEQRSRAYAPYSNYTVGCVVYAPNTPGQEFFFGSNIENSSYGLTICAERVALFNYAKHPHRTPIQTLVYASTADNYYSPCGACLQVMIEFMEPDSVVIHHNGTGYKAWILKELIPFANPRVLG